MFKLLGLPFVLAAIAAAVAYYLGWFSFTTTKVGQSTHISAAGREPTRISIEPGVRAPALAVNGGDIDTLREAGRYA